MCRNTHEMTAPLLDDDAEAGAGSLRLDWERVTAHVGAAPASRLERVFCRRKDDAPRLKVALTRRAGPSRPARWRACSPVRAGKTTLLSILGARPQLGAGGSWTGRVLVNGAAPRTLWLRDLGFVMQRDIFFDTLTVGQELAFAAATRLPRSWTPERRRQRAAEVAAQLGLTSVLPSKIGSAVERGLSGGEVKRLNICVELLNDPRLLLLDEPLTGLDSSRAFSVLEALRARATAGHRAILLSVHQPTSKLWLLFDKLVLMAPGGRVAYEGSASDAEAFFESCGLPLPASWNPPDHYVECLGDEPAAAPRPRGEAPRGGGRRRRARRGALAGLRRAGARARWPGPAQRPGAMLKPPSGSSCCASLIWGWLWYRVDAPGGRAAHASDVVSVVFFVVAQWSWGPAFQQLGAFPSERDVLTKERASEVYSIEAYFVAKLLCELPVLALMPLAFLIILLPMVAVPRSCFAAVYGAALLVSWVSQSLSNAISAAVFKTDHATTVVIIAMVYCMCCGGFFIDMEQQPGAISWVRFTSYWYYSMGLFAKVALLPYDTPHHDMRAEIDTYSFSTLSLRMDVAVLVASDRPP
ncbi:ATPase [Aureococcus anophagefferens]|nr:ATPase [Aureococcus anophagefferens]